VGKSKKAIVWFRSDLRLHDNEALCDAHQHASKIIPIYIFDEREFLGKTRFGFPKTDKYRAQFVIESVINLRKNLESVGSGLVVRIGKPEEIIPEIAREEKTHWVFCNRERTAEEVYVQDTLEEQLWSIGQEVRYSRGKMLYYTADLPFPVTHTPDIFTNFRKEVEKFTQIREPLVTPSLDDSFESTIEYGEIPELKDFGHSETFEKRDVYYLEGGEDAALAELAYYFSEKKLPASYYETRNQSLGRDYSTKFSAYLSSGCLSPKQVYHTLGVYEKEYGSSKSSYWIFFELLWRDFFRLMGKKYKEKIFLRGGIRNETKPVETDSALFESWKTGQTGFPFIDACMRQLNATGFMSNRGRQNVASFLIHDLGLNWQLGASYFESLLIDYDPCSNYGNWNYLAGIGNDPREQRKFNVVLQSKKYDAEGNFIRYWIPELKELDSKRVHFTSEFEQADLGNLILGKDYPFPIVDSYNQFAHST